MSDLTPRQHGQRVAVFRALADEVSARQEAARSEAEKAFKIARNEGGVKSLDVTLDDGTPLGSIAIKVGPTTVKVSEPALFKHVEATAPGEVVEELTPGALTDPGLLEWVKANRPHLIARKVRGSYRTKLLKSIDGTGRLVDKTTGEMVKVAEIHHEKPTGAFAYTPNKTAAEAIMRAWAAGELAGVLGDLLSPAIESGGES